jgi:metal-dependent amidase/aminoacylase/carboxypeptidase family protein
MRARIHTRIREISEGVAASMGATVEVKIPLSNSYPMTVNNPAIADTMVPVLEAIAGPENVESISAVIGAEDFSYISERVPSLYIQLGGGIPGQPLNEVGDHHTPDFLIDESGFDLGVQAMAAMAWKYMIENP